MIVYDREDDDTLQRSRRAEWTWRMAIEFVRDRGRGSHGAVLTGFAASDAPFVVVYPAEQ